jgi:hypothetical protein
VQGHLPMMPMSPIIHPRVKEVRTDSGSLRQGRCDVDGALGTDADHLVCFKIYLFIYSIYNILPPMYAWEPEEGTTTTVSYYRWL